MRTLISRLSDRVRLLLTAPLLVLAVACKAPTRDQVVTALTDARWGLSAACSQEWVPASDCAVADPGLGVAIDVAKQVPVEQIKPDVIATLKGIAAALPPESRALPYFTYVLTFLQSV